MLDHLIDPDDPSARELYAEKESENMSFEEVLEFLDIPDDEIEEYSKEEIRDMVYEKLRDDYDPDFRLSLRI